MIEFQESREHQAVDVRVQRTDLGGQFDGQHGHSAVRKIYAGTAQARLGIDGGAGTDVMADVRNMYVQGEIAVFQALHPDRVVEVAGGFAVDGDDIEAAEIPAAFQLPGSNHAGDLLRLLHDFGWELMRQVVLADHDFDVDTEVAGTAQNLD